MGVCLGRVLEGRPIVRDELGVIENTCDDNPPMALDHFLVTLLRPAAFLLRFLRFAGVSPG